MKDLGGRPLKFKSPAILEKKIEGFFKLCARTREIPLVEGLALYLNCSMLTILNYEEKDAYAPIIKKAKLLIANGMMQRAVTGKTNPQIATFIAKNHYGYKDDSGLRLEGNAENPIQHKHDHKFKNALDVNLTPSQAYQRMLDGD